MDRLVVCDAIGQFHDTASLRETEVPIGTQVRRIYREDNPGIWRLLLCGVTAEVLCRTPVHFPDAVGLSASTIRSFGAFGPPSR